MGGSPAERKSVSVSGGDQSGNGGIHCPQTCALFGQSPGLGTSVGEIPYSIGWLLQPLRRGASPHTFARAALVALRKARQSKAFTNP